MNRARSLSRQAVALAAGSAGAQVLVAILYISAARSAPPRDYGIVVTAIALGAVGATLLDLGSSPYWIREIASGRLAPDQLLPMMATKLLIASGLATIVTMLAVSLDPHFIATGVLMLSYTCVIMALVPLRAAQRAEHVGLITALNRVVAVMAFFSQTSLGIKPGLALWTSIAAGDLFLLICVGFVLRSRLRMRSLRLTNPWSGTKWFSVSSVSASAQALDLPFLAIFSGPTAAGIYGGVNRWTVPMALATSSFSSAAAPHLAAATDLRALRRPLLRASWMLVSVVGLSTGVIFAAPWLVRFLLGNAYSDSAAVLQWLAAAAILNAITQPLLVMLLSRRFDHLAGMIFLASGGIQLILVALLGPTLGALGAGLALFTAQLIQAIATSVAITVIWRQRRRSKPELGNLA